MSSKNASRNENYIIYARGTLRCSMKLPFSVLCTSGRPIKVCFDINIGTTNQSPSWRLK